MDFLFLENIFVPLAGGTLSSNEDTSNILKLGLGE
jgi:hypothetical protein